jgi:hypothetical protein
MRSAKIQLPHIHNTNGMENNSSKNRSAFKQRILNDPESIRSASFSLQGVMTVFSNERLRGEFFSFFCFLGHRSHVYLSVLTTVYGAPFNNEGMMMKKRKRLQFVFQCLLLAVTVFQCGIVFAAWPETVSIVRVRRALQRLYTDTKYQIRFSGSSVDLNGDGLSEYVAYVKGSELYGNGGFSTVVLTPEKKGYRVVTEIFFSQPPVFLLSDSEEEWRNLAVFVAGNGVQPGHMAELRFDGITYPESPTVLPARKIRDKAQGRILISKSAFYSKRGHLVYPKQKRSTGPRR